MSMIIEKRVVEVFHVNGKDFTSLEAATAHVDRLIDIAREKEILDKKRAYLAWLNTALYRHGYTWCRGDCYEFMARNFEEVAKWFGYRVEKM